MESNQPCESIGEVDIIFMSIQRRLEVEVEVFFVFNDVTYEHRNDNTGRESVPLSPPLAVWESIKKTPKFGPEDLLAGISPFRIFIFNVPRISRYWKV